jgi:hypothetical protein
MAKRTAHKVLTADNPVIDQYYARLAEYEEQRVRHEGAVSTAFADLLIIEPARNLRTSRKLSVLFPQGLQAGILLF